MPDKLGTAVIVLNHNDNANALKLACALDTYQCVGLILVADNGGENSLKQLDGKKTRLINVPNNGYAAGNNAAISYVVKNYGMPEIIVISNPDVAVNENAVRACVDFLRENPDYAVAAPRMCTPDGQKHHLSAWKERTLVCDLAYSSGILSRTIGMYRECYGDDHFNGEVSDVDCVAGSFFAVRGEALNSVGLFDEHTFLYYEEDILGFKLKRMGYKTAVLNRYTFTHYEGVSVDRSMNILKKYLNMQKSRLYFHRVYKRTGPAGCFLLCAATCLGVLEKSLKVLISAFYHKFNHVGS